MMPLQLPRWVTHAKYADYFSHEARIDKLATVTRHGLTLWRAHDVRQAAPYPEIATSASKYAVMAAVEEYFRMEETRGAAAEHTQAGLLGEALDALRALDAVCEFALPYAKHVNQDDRLNKAFEQARTVLAKAGRA